MATDVTARTPQAQQRLVLLSPQTCEKPCEFCYTAEHTYQCVTCYMLRFSLVEHSCCTGCINTQQARSVVDETIKQFVSEWRRHVEIDRVDGVERRWNASVNEEGLCREALAKEQRQILEQRGTRIQIRCNVGRCSPRGS